MKALVNMTPGNKKKGQAVSEETRQPGKEKCNGAKYEKRS
jgi:hypothetical protein